MLKVEDEKKLKNEKKKSPAQSELAWQVYDLDCGAKTFS
jgi:hypothetical protein